MHLACQIFNFSTLSRSDIRDVGAVERGGSTSTTNGCLSPSAPAPKIALAPLSFQARDEFVNVHGVYVSRHKDLLYIWDHED